MAKADRHKSKPQLRDPEKTRGRILAAALKEFSAKGLTGARVDEIARRAKINKRMLYHYFGNKRDLFHAVLRRKIEERQARARTFSDDPTENLPDRFQTNCQDADWVRLLNWESLQVQGSRIEDEQSRREATERSLNDLLRRQQQGFLNPAFDERHLALATLSLTMFPTAFPHLTRLITGKPPHDPEFQRGYMKFLKEFAVAFQSPHNRGKDPAVP